MAGQGGQGAGDGPGHKIMEIAKCDSHKAGGQGGASRLPHNECRSYNARINLQNAIRKKKV